MTRSLRFNLVLASALALATSLHAQRPPLSGFDRYVEKALLDWQVPGVAIAVVKDDTIVLARGYGVKNIETKERVDEKTIFGIASNTKAFAAASLAILVDEKKISWDDPVTKYLPHFQMKDPYVTRELRIRDLLAHRNGLPPYGGDIMTWGSNYSREQIVARIRHVEPVSSFRSEYAYQNGMFITAGEIVEAVTGKTWDDFVRERFFVPLRMSATSTSVTSFEPRSNVATPHIFVDGRVETIPWRNIDNLGAAAAINSNVVDLAQWIRLQLGEGSFEGKQLFSRKAAHEMWMPQTLLRVGLPEAQARPVAKWSAYGLGWQLRDYHGHRLIRHGGWTDGMLSTVAMIPEKKIGLAILTNLHNRNLSTALMYRIFDAWLALPAEDWSAYFLGRVKSSEAEAAAETAKRAAARVRDTKPSLPLEAYTGTYENEVYGQVRVALSNGRLTIDFVHSPTYKGVLEHWHYDTFITKWRERIPDAGPLWFTLTPEGKVRDLTTSLGDFVEPGNYTFVKR